MTDLRRMTAFRDVQLAEDFKKMAEEGYLDQEFTVYGIVYLKDGTRNYVISSDETLIWEQAQALLLQDIYPSPVTHLTKICHVPVGEEERISTEVKVALAQMLSDDYSVEDLQRITVELRSIENPNLFLDIQGYCKDVEGCFSAERIQLAKSLVELGYIHKNITEVQYRVLLDWLKYEEKNIQDDVVRKDLIEKSFYTLLYSDQKGRKKIVTNARKEWIYNKTVQLMQKGMIVAPFFTATYWYHYQSMLDQVKATHEEKAKQWMDDAYFSIVEKIFLKEENRIGGNAMVESENNTALSGEKAREMLKRYMDFLT